MGVNSATKKKLMDIGIEEYLSNNLARDRVWNDIVELTSNQIANMFSLSMVDAENVYDLISQKHQSETRVFDPLANGGWPEVDFEEDDSSLLAKYSDEELIQLASLNPGFGFREFMMELYPKGEKTSYRNSVVMQFLKENQGPNGTNLYADLQDPSHTSWVTKEKYKQVTGEKYLPQGYGSRGSSGGKKAKLDSRQALVPLPPQDFDWGDVIPSSSRPSNRYGKFRMRARSMLNIRIDLNRIWKYYEDGYTYGEVSREMTIPYPQIQKWTNHMIQYEEAGVLIPWLELVEYLNALSSNRGNQSQEDDNSDEVYVFIRNITKSYLNNPHKWSKRPTIDSLKLILDEITSLQGTDGNSPEISHEEETKIEIIGNQISSEFNFRLDRMVSGGFYSPIIEQVARLQVQNGATCLLINCGSSVAGENIAELANSLINEYDCKVMIQSSDQDVIDKCKTSIEHSKLILIVNSVNEIDSASEITWVITPIQEVFEIDPDLYEFSQIDFFDEILEQVEDKADNENIWLQPVFEGFLSERVIKSGSANLANADGRLDAAQNFFFLIRKLAQSKYPVLADCKPALRGLSSSDSVKERLIMQLNSNCIEYGAGALILDTNLSEMTFPKDEELEVQINQLIDGSSNELLKNYTPFNFKNKFGVYLS
jgi:hypothetical protein